MQAVTRPASGRRASLLVPMVSALFIEIANALAIKLCLTLPIYG
ncbi:MULTISPECIES: sodium:glutamate symporter [Burkholderia]|uniref:ESS family glutamate:Na+ symporter n=1 Tax=Burkholderia pyrrocinia TaxID=60550 RepID=A0A318HSI8_BURPY|nr:MULTISPECIES: sodium:glutamate symporter [Burkholderia]PXX21309.1 ESS family glutamate:Na+ symporter [Burkholderia pyrrocinia]SFW91354.1 sodium--glutamate symport carrier (gltS) [Burkholderia sp. NFACC33-1]SFY46596.1 sodium--glutamate symport carrier (gltS) [Burkholderia sp. NFPP32]